MLYEVLRFLNNFFVPEKAVRIAGDLEIKDGEIALNGILEGQYFLIEGSVLNDGVYQYPAYGLKDERFSGTVTGLAVPEALVSLADEIEAYQASENPSQFISESFGGYSYTKATNSSGGVASWKDVYRGRLNSWRKI